MEGTYRIAMKTPLGVQKGELTLTRQGDLLSGSIRVMGSVSPVKGKAEGDSFEFTGVLRAGFYRFAYTARGSVADGHLKAVASTRSGSFAITGERI